MPGTRNQDKDGKKKITWIHVLKVRDDRLIESARQSDAKRSGWGMWNVKTAIPVSSFGKNVREANQSTNGKGTLAMRPVANPQLY